MTGWQTVVAHVTIALAAIGGVCALSVEGIIPGSDAFSVIMAVLVGAGVIAGGALMSSSTPPTSPPAPPVA